jgi:hypothetical protein
MICIRLPLANAARNTEASSACKRKSFIVKHRLQRVLLPNRAYRARLAHEILRPRSTPSPTYQKLIQIVSARKQRRGDFAHW